MTTSEELVIMKRMHTYLMEQHFPYHSVSVVEQHGLRVIFSNGIRDMVSDDIKEYIVLRGFTCTINPK